MAVFAYEAVDGRRSSVEGTIAADTPRQARELLRARGLRVHRVHQHEVTIRRRWWQFQIRRGFANKAAATTRELSTLLAVGIPLSDALETLAREHRGRFRTALLMVRDRILQGASLAEAMAEHPNIFDSLSVRMVQVGENSGRLDVVLDQLAGYKERSLQLKDRVLTALLYPAVVLSAAIGVSLFLMIVVVPMLLTNLQEMGRTLPWPTRILKGASDLLVSHGWIVFLGAAAMFVGLLSISRTQRGRLLIHRGLLRIPLIGSMIMRQNISRAAMIMSTLLRGGVVYMSALEIAARSSSNLVIRRALEQSGEEIGAGRDLGSALEKTGVFPPLVVHVFSVGQESGQLEDLLDRLAADYDRQVATQSTRLATVLEPVLIMVLAVIVGFILFATLLPILEAGNVL